jgi:hypothetical protein
VKIHHNETIHPITPLQTTLFSPISSNTTSLPTGSPITLEPNHIETLHIEKLNINVRNETCIRHSFEFTEYAIPTLPYSAKTTDINLSSLTPSIDSQSEAQGTWNEILGINLDKLTTLYETVSSYANQGTIGKLIVSEINHHIFSTYKPTLTGQKYIDIGIKAATFSALATLSSPFISNMLVEPILESAESLYHEGSLTISDIFGSIHDNWIESWSELKPLSITKSLTSSVYSIQSQIIRDTACELSGLKFVCSLLKSMPVSVGVKQIIKSELGDDLFNQADGSPPLATALMPEIIPLLNIDII